jgi:hypothetical protein
VDDVQPLVQRNLRALEYGAYSDRELAATIFASEKTGAVRLLFTADRRDLG